MTGRTYRASIGGIHAAVIVAGHVLGRYHCLPSRGQVPAIPLTYPVFPSGTAPIPNQAGLSAGSGAVLIRHQRRPPYDDLW